MGYIKHHTIVVTGFTPEKVIIAHKKAKEIFEKNFQKELYTKNISSRLVSDVIEGLANGQTSFFIAPDGSKEGWETSNNADDAREQFLDWLSKSETWCDYIEVTFGGDDEAEYITRSNEKDNEL
jgi:hypothetical protein